MFSEKSFGPRRDWRVSRGQRCQQGKRKGQAGRVGAIGNRVTLPQNENIVDHGEKLHIQSVMAKTATKKAAVRKESDLLANLRKLAAKIPAVEMAKIPKDASITYKKYLYGQSK